MQNFDLRNFSRHLLSEALFYDEEYGAFGNVSLVDHAAAQERYLASYNPEDGNYLIERAVEWEDYESGEDEDDIGYALAVDGEEYASYESAEETADELLRLAEADDLMPSIIVLFEEEEA